MKIEDFSIGDQFYTASGKWQCTDIGTRVIVAIKLGEILIICSNTETGTGEEVLTDDQSWFNGPPYAVVEHVFDEFSMGGCGLDPADFSTST